MAWTDRSWAEITPRQIAQFKAHLLDLGLSNTSVNRALATIKSFFSWLSRAYPETLQHNPTPAVSLEKVPLPPPRDLSEVEVTAIFDALLRRGDTQIRDTAMLLVLSHGLRAGEVCGLNVGDFDGVRLTIQKAKDDSTGTVPLNRLAREQLTAYLEWRRDLEGNLLQDCPLFVSLGRNNGGERLGYKGIYNVVKELGEAAGIKDLTPHRLRHTYATNLLLKGMDSFLARSLTRHKSEASFQRYAKRARAVAAERAFYQAIGEEPPCEG
jgi:integrase/recombinase XerD